MTLHPHHNHAHLKQGTTQHRFCGGLPRNTFCTNHPLLGIATGKDPLTSPRTGTTSLSRSLHLSRRVMPSLVLLFNTATGFCPLTNKFTPVLAPPAPAMNPTKIVHGSCNFHQAQPWHLATGEKYISYYIIIHAIFAIYIRSSKYIRSSIDIRSIYIEDTVLLLARFQQQPYCAFIFDD